MNLNYNRVHFQWQRDGDGYSVEMDARGERFRPTVSIARMRVVDRDLPVYTYSQDGVRDAWTVAEGALGDAGSRWLPVRRPDLYAGEVFQKLARAQGITLGNVEEAMTPPEGQLLAQHESPPLSRVIELMLRYSTNLTAEVIACRPARRGAGIRVR